MLPYDAGSQWATPRYANYAMSTLLVDVTTQGADLSRLEAKIFGGARMLSELRLPGMDLGMRNVEVARAMLAAARVPVIAEDVGGIHGRKIVFRTDTGVVMMRFVSTNI